MGAVVMTNSNKGLELAKDIFLDLGLKTGPKATAAPPSSSKSNPESDSPPTPLELAQSVRQVFQMSQHKADELRSLPIEKCEYNKCSEGTLYIPIDVVEKLQNVLQSAKGNDELLSVFESELVKIVDALEKGSGTGEVINAQDEFIPKRFEGVARQLTGVMDTLAQMKQEAVVSKVSDPEIGPVDHPGHST